MSTFTKPIQVCKYCNEYTTDTCPECGRCATDISLCCISCTKDPQPEKCWKKKFTVKPKEWEDYESEDE